MKHCVVMIGVMIGMIVAAVITAAPVRAAEARPWLCRDKPVFSSAKPMSYEASKRGSGRWLLTFMRFDASGQGHDGFTVVSSQDVVAHTGGTLQAGQWYAVALLRSGGRWMCPGNSRESEASTPGTLSNVC